MLYKNWKEYDYEKIKNAPMLTEGRRQYAAPSRYYLDLVTAFDIETTNDTESKQAYMYIWQYAIEDDVIIGRYWEELQDFIAELKKNIPGEAVLVTYVHNLEFEFQFLKSRFEISDVLATDAHAVIKCDVAGIEFRCSARHSGMKLDKYLKSQDVPVEYQKTKLDYGKVRYPWTELSDDEMNYCINDVLGLTKAIRHELTKDGETLATIPYTVTGYARRDARKTLYPSKAYYWECLQNDRDLMDALRMAFRGGNTHANRYYVTTGDKTIITDNVVCYDISSSYPSVLLQERFPQAFQHEPDPACLWWYMARGRACLAYVHLDNVQLKDEQWPIPYIAAAKTEKGRGLVKDNGRILEAEAIEMWLTEIDLYIIRSEYNCNITCLDLWTAKKAKLPISYRMHLLDLYKDKTSLKGIKDKADEYRRSKTIFDSNYGLMVQNPIKAQWRYNADTMTIEEDTETPIQTLLDRYSEGGLLPYQWGVYCTAYARLKLERGLRCIDPEDVLYVDTDSIHFIYNEKYVQDLEALNDIMKDEELFADDKNGRRHYIGTFELESKEDKFATMGAKKYVSETDGQITVTIAGVDKEEGSKELLSIDRFKNGCTFEKAGGLMAYYNNYGKVIKTADGREIETGTNCYLEKSTYTLGIDDDYKKVLEFLETHDAKRSLHYER